MTDRFPDQALERALRSKGYAIRCNWQIKGPKDTGIAWMECLTLGGVGSTGIVIVQTYKGGGWEAYIPASNRNDIDATINGVINSLKENA